MDNNEVIPLNVTKITSTPPRYWDNDYQIIDWDEAGLEHQSTVRLSQQYSVNYVGDYIGHLTQRDIENIEELLLDSN